MQSNKKLLTFIFMLLLTAIWLIGCQQETIYSSELSSQAGVSTLEREAKPAFKGMELYSWQDETGEWYYSILIGTNRVKSIDEILSKPIGFDEVKAYISKMAVGESVFWFNDAYNSSDGQNNDFAFPPKEVIEELKQHALAYQVMLYTQDE